MALLEGRTNPTAVSQPIRGGNDGTLMPSGPRRAGLTAATLATLATELRRVRSGLEGLTGGAFTLPPGPSYGATGSSTLLTPLQPRRPDPPLVPVVPGQADDPLPAATTEEEDEMFLGTRVTKTEDLSAAQDDLFVVTGKVLMTLMTGEVTNAIDAAVVDYQLRIKTVNVGLCGQQNIANSVVGAIWNVPGSLSANLIGNAADAKVAAFVYDGTLSYHVIGLAGGSCTIESVHTAGAAGDAIVWTLYYVPLETGASVAAAA